MAAIDGRTIHAYHVEGVGGGHIPDLIGIVREPNVICSSTTPGLPYARATAAEHVDMILIVHEGNPALAEDLAAARERIHPATMAAEGPLHDLGAISIINSDSQGMGRIGETVRRTWQLAHVMKAWRASEAGSGWPNEPADDNARVLRYLAKITAEPARTHGIHDEVGSLAPGHLADLVLWERGLVRGQAGRRDEGRRRRVGTDRRGERVRARIRANPVRSRLGRDGRRAGGLVDHVRLRRRARGRDRSDARHPPPGRRRRWNARHRTRRSGREHRGAGDRGLPDRRHRDARRPGPGGGAGGRACLSTGAISSRSPSSRRALRPRHLAQHGPFPPDSIGICPKRGGPAPSAPAMGPSS